jgi:hypothetical protein
LDVGAQQSLLGSSEIRFAIEQFAKDSALHFEFRNAGNRSGWYLAHPALAWPLFQAWAEGEGESAALMWGRHLGQGLRALLVEQQSTAARRIGGELLEKDTYRKLFRQSAATEHAYLRRVVIQSVYEAIEPDLLLTLQAPLLAIWVVAAHAGCLATGTPLGVMPRAERALTADDLNDEIKTEIAAALLRVDARKANAQVLGLAKDCLLRASVTPAVVRFFEYDLSRAARYVSARDLLIAWLSAKTRDPGAARVFCRAIERTSDQQLVALTVTFVRRCADKDGVAQVVWQLLLRHPTTPGLQLVVKNWLAVTPDQDDVPKIISKALRHWADWHGLRKSALAWLERHGASLASWELLAQLARGDHREVRLQRVLSRWLEHHRQSREAGQLLASLVLNRASRIQWLEEADAHVAATVGQTRNVVLAALVSKALDPVRALLALAILRRSSSSDEASSYRYLQALLAQGLAMAAPTTLDELTRRVAEPDRARLKRMLESGSDRVRESPRSAVAGARHGIRRKEAGAANVG